MNQNKLEKNEKEMQMIRERKELKAIMADCKLWEDVHCGSYSGDYWD